jgi:hypothetical protein
MKKLASILLSACSASSLAIADSNDGTDYEAIGRPISEINAPLPAISRSTPFSLSDDGSKKRLEDLEIPSLESALPVDTLKIREELLHGPSHQGPLAGGVRFGSLPQDQVLQLSIEGRAYTLSIVEEVQDLKRGVRHIVAMMRNEPGGYARFTVDGASKQVVGTLRTAYDKYRIAPHPSGQQLVFREKQPEALMQAGQSSMASGRRPLSNLERIHQRAEMLATIQPWRARIEEDAGYLFVQEGNLGTLRDNSTAGVREVIQRLGALTLLDVVPTIRITGVFRSASGNGPQIIRFEQLINGIPVERRNEIRVDNAGEITEVTTSFINPELVAAQALLPPEAAEGLARNALDFELRGTAGKVSIIVAPALSYIVSNAQLELAPVYRLTLATEAGEPFVITVGAGNGQTTVMPAAIHVEGDQYRHRVCTKTTTIGASNPTSCELSNTPLVWSERTDTPGTIQYKCHYTFHLSNPNNPCPLAKHQTPRDVMHSVNAAWEQATANSPGVCCSNVGDTGGVNDSRVDVLVGSSPAGGGALYWPQSDTIVLPDNYSLNPDAIAHEAAHAHQNAYNGQLLNATGFKRSVAEGLADAATAIWAEKTGYSGTGSAWVIGDGTSGIFSQRDLTTARTWADLNTSPNQYAQGAVIGNYFYRLRQTGAVSINRFLEYTLDVQIRVVDVNGDGMDLYDLKRALTDAVRPGETGLLNAVNQTFSGMNNVSSGPGGPSDIPAGPGQPGAPNAPPPPTGLSGQPLGCFLGPSGEPLSYYTVSFNLSSGATSYDGFFRHSSGLYYIYGGSGTTSPTNAGANFNTVLRVRACNTNGCSALSSSSVTITANLCN